MVVIYLKKIFLHAFFKKNACKNDKICSKIFDRSLKIFKKTSSERDINAISSSSRRFFSEKTSSIDQLIKFFKKKLKLNIVIVTRSSGNSIFMVYISNHLIKAKIDKTSIEKTFLMMKKDSRP